MTLLRALTTGLMAMGFVAWFLLLRPAVLAGPATYLWVSGVSMEPTLESGDFVVLQHADHYRIGQIVAYRVPEGHPGAGALVIHRIVDGNGVDGFVMRGDNKPVADEAHPTNADVVGAVWVTMAGAGGYLAWLHNPAILAPLAAGITVFLILIGGPDRRKRAAPEPQA